MLDPHSIFMIWPEFQDENGNVITRTDSVVAREGIARMWIINPQTRPLHRDKIKLGLKGYFMEGSRQNPTSPWKKQFSNCLTGYWFVVDRDDDLPGIATGEPGFLTPDAYTGLF